MLAPISSRYASLFEETPFGAEDSQRDLSLATTPIFTGDTLANGKVSPQYAFYGRVLEQNADGFPSQLHSGETFINTNAPFSAIVCGAPGSGKTHSTSVLLESCMIHDDRLGTLQTPSSALWFHFDSAARGTIARPCEAAYLASIDPARGAGAVAPTVTVLVMPNSLCSMRRVYSGLSGVDVQPLYFASEDMNGERILPMVNVDFETQTLQYRDFIITHLLKLGAFDYNAFRSALNEQEFTAEQKAMLNIRLSLLNSCLERGTRANAVSNHFGPGKLTIIDLSSPFMDSSSAGGLFDIILDLFMDVPNDASGKIVVFDEPQTYLIDGGNDTRLVNSLWSMVRHQRHLNTSVIISTKEPDLIPSKLLKLFSFAIVHKLSSQQEIDYLLHHIHKTSDAEPWHSKINSLPTGESLMLAPSGLSVRNGSSEPSSRIAQLRSGYLHVKSRLRITRDGGSSPQTASVEHVRFRVLSEVLNSPQSEPCSSKADESSERAQVFSPCNLVESDSSAETSAFAVVEPSAEAAALPEHGSMSSQSEPPISALTLADLLDYLGKRRQQDKGSPTPPFVSPRMPVQPECGSSHHSEQACSPTLLPQVSGSRQSLGQVLSPTLRPLDSSCPPSSKETRSPTRDELVLGSDPSFGKTPDMPGSDSSEPFEHTRSLRPDIPSFGSSRSSEQAGLPNTITVADSGSSLEAPGMSVSAYEAPDNGEEELQESLEQLPPPTSLAASSDHLPTSSEAETAVEARRVLLDLLAYLDQRRQRGKDPCKITRAEAALRLLYAGNRIPPLAQVVQDAYDRHLHLVRPHEDGRIEAGRFAALVNVLLELKSEGTKRPDRSLVIERIRGRGGAAALGSNGPSEYLRAAEKAGLIQRLDDRVKLLKF